MWAHVIASWSGSRLVPGFPRLALCGRPVSLFVARVEGAALGELLMLGSPRVLGFSCFVLSSSVGFLLLHFGAGRVRFD